jgi:copper(I)-binding protein
MFFERLRHFGLLVTAMALTSGVATSAPAADIQVDDAWIRWLPADVPSAGYMTLVNKGSADRVLIAVSSPAYAEISIHHSQEDQGVSTMRPVDSITLKPRSELRFAEGGYHLMLMRPRRPVHPGDTLVMTLRFSEGPPIDVVFSVRSGG